MQRIHAIRSVTKYNGVVGGFHRLWDRLVVLVGGSRNVFREGSKEWEAFEELSKIDELIGLRRSARMGGLVDPAILDHEIAFLQGMRARHEAVVRAAEESNVDGHVSVYRIYDGGERHGRARDDGGAR